MELPKSWGDVIPWLQAFNELCSTVEYSGVWMECGVWYRLIRMELQESSLDMTNA